MPAVCPWMGHRPKTKSKDRDRHTHTKINAEDVRRGDREHGAGNHHPRVCPAHRDGQEDKAGLSSGTPDMLGVGWELPGSCRGSGERIPAQGWEQHSGLKAGGRERTTAGPPLPACSVTPPLPTPLPQFFPLSLLPSLRNSLGFIFLGQEDSRTARQSRRA